MLVIIQARMSSNRLPGKVLMPLAGKPMLAWIVERVVAANYVSRVIVATSNEVDDDSIASYCKKYSIPCFRGNLLDVASRMMEAVKKEKADCFVRISGDSPLIDSKLIDQAIKIYYENEYDLVTNVLKRTFPKGQSVEVLRTKTFIETYPIMNNVEREHVTFYYYLHPEKFKIFNFISKEITAEKVQFSVDTYEDYQIINALIIATKGKIDLGWSDFIKIKNNNF